MTIQQTGKCRRKSGNRRLQLIAYIGVATIGIMICSCKPQIKTSSGRSIRAVEMDRFLQEQMDSLGIPALSIAFINDGRIVYHRALGVTDTASSQKVDEHSLFEAASISKPVFAYFTMKMMEKGILALDTPLYRYLPFPDSVQDERYRRVTARMVLSHTTGFPNWRWLDPETGEWGDRKMYLLYEPGTFSYSGEAYHYLAQVVAHLNGITLNGLDSLFRQEVAIPLGMEYAYFSWNERMARHKVTGYKQDGPEHGKWEAADAMYADSTVFGAANAFHTEAVGYARFLIAFMENQGLNNESVEEMLKMQAHIPEEQAANWGGIKGWGLGFAIEPTDRGTRYSHSGHNPGFLAGCMFYKEQKNGYVFFINNDQAGPFFARLRAFLGEDYFFSSQ